MSPQELMKEHGIASLQLAKVDIEGAEVEALSSPSAPDWLRRTNEVWIEAEPPRIVFRRVLRAFAESHHRDRFVGLKLRFLPDSPTVGKRAAASITIDCKRIDE